MMDFAVFLPESALDAYYCIDYYDSCYRLDHHGPGHDRRVRDLRCQGVIEGLHRGWTEYETGVGGGPVEYAMAVRPKSTFCHLGARLRRAK